MQSITGRYLVWDSSYWQFPNMLFFWATRSTEKCKNVRNRTLMARGFKERLKGFTYTLISGCWWFFRQRSSVLLCFFGHYIYRLSTVQRKHSTDKNYINHSLFENGVVSFVHLHLKHCRAFLDILKKTQAQKTQNSSKIPEKLKNCQLNLSFYNIKVAFLFL